MVAVLLLYTILLILLFQSVLRYAAYMYRNVHPMPVSIHSSSVLWLPLVITFMGRQHRVEVVGKLVPFCKYFTCRIPGADILVFEAISGSTPCRFSWVASTKHQFSYLVPFIGKEIEKYLA